MVRTYRMKGQTGLKTTARGILGVISAFGLDQQRRGLSAETVRVRRVVLRSFFDSVDKEATEVTKNDIDEWLDSLQLVARSRGKYLSHLHMFFRFCMVEGVLKVDPTQMIDRPRAPKLLPRPIGTDDLTMALEMASPKVGAMLALACYEGLRCMEIAGFEVDWIWRHTNPPILAVMGKGGKQRMVPLGSETESFLRRHGLPKAGHVFLTRFGKPYLPRSISMMLGNYLRGLGIDATAHQLRHWFGSEVYAGCQDLLVTQELMGHSDPSTTRGYVAITPRPETAAMVRSLHV